MKIAIHSNQLDGRGTGKAIYDYAFALRNILNHEVSFIVSEFSNNERMTQFKESFEVSTYNKNLNSNRPDEIKKELESYVSKNNIDFFYMIKAGENDGFTPSNCKTGIHCVFDMTHKHGNVYAGVSKFLSNKFNQSLYVPHIIKNFNPTINVRKEMGISDDTIIVGRIGGIDTFDIPFVHNAIKRTLDTRKNIIFFFVCTNQFYYHDRILYIPPIETEEEKFNLIHSCDVMLHGRHVGETFGIACGEFSVANKPVITWSGIGNPYYDKCHTEILGDKAIIYNNETELVNILCNLNKKDLENKNWDAYSEKFNETEVMNQYNNVFLK